MGDISDLVGRFRDQLLSPDKESRGRRRVESWIPLFFTHLFSDCRDEYNPL